MKFQSLLIFLLATTVLFAEEHDLESKIENVTIYIQGAEVNRTANINLSGGQHLLKFKGISPDMQKGSMNIIPSDGLTILSITEKYNFLADEKSTSELTALKTQLDDAQFKWSQTQHTVNALQAERNMIVANQVIAGANTGLTATQLREMADFFRSRLKEVDDLMYTSRIDLQKNLETYNKFKQQYDELNGNINPNKTEVWVDVMVKRNGNHNFKIRHLVQSAGWAPTYDIVSENINSTIQLKYRAKAFNNSGIDWINLPIKLSTADPFENATKPELKKWELGYNQGLVNVSNKSVLNSAQQQSSMGYGLDNWRGSTVQQSGGKQITMQEIEVDQLSAEFDIKEKYSIKADAKPYLIEIEDYKLEADFTHFTAPKIKNGAFLLANVTGWTELNLVEGEANIYHNNAFLGKSYIYTNSLDDTISLSLGRDQNIQVRRDKQKQFSSVKTFGSNKKETLHYRISVKNNNNQKVQIEIQDQIPISTDNSISVDVEEVSKGMLNDISGIITWKLDLKPGETRNIDLVYSIKYPKNRNVQLKQNRVLYSPKF